MKQNMKRNKSLAIREKCIMQHCDNTGSGFFLQGYQSDLGESIPSKCFSLLAICEDCEKIVRHESCESRDGMRRLEY